MNEALIWLMMIVMNIKCELTLRTIYFLNHFCCDDDGSIVVRVCCCKHACIVCLFALALSDIFVLDWTAYLYYYLLS